MSFQSNDMWTESRVCGENLTGQQFRFVKLNAAGRVVRCNTAGERAYGILLNKPNTGETAQVVKAPGGNIVVAGAAIAAIGAELQTDNQGRAIPAVAGDYVNAIAKQTASAAGDEISADGVTYQKN